jgi:hypothetical protein
MNLQTEQHLRKLVEAYGAADFATSVHSEKFNIATDSHLIGIGELLNVFRKQREEALVLIKFIESLKTHIRRIEGSYFAAPIFFGWVKVYFE